MTDPLHTIEAAVEALRRGDVVGVPTDTVYGLAVDPMQGLDALYALKGRRPEAPIVILVADREQASALGVLDEAVSEAIEAHWPGALTVVVPRSETCPPHLGDPVRGTIGLRAPDHPDLRALLRAFGPLAVTSANRSGGPPAISAKGAQSVFGRSVASYLEGESPGGTASTVVDFTISPPAVLREGPVEWFSGAG